MAKNMSNIIVKGNAFIESSYSLDVAEQRLIFLAILVARQLGDDIPSVLNQTITIPAKAYVEHFKVERQTAYEALRNGVNGLFEAEFGYTAYEPTRNKVEVFRKRFVQEISYVNDLGLVRLVFSKDVVPLIVGLQEKFTKYEIEQVAGLQSRYSIRLYELLIKWRSVGSTGEIPTQQLRASLGLSPTEYTRMGNFRQKILDKSLVEINTVTDIDVVCETVKEGREVVAFIFNFTKKKAIEGKCREIKSKRGRKKAQVVEPMVEEPQAVITPTPEPPQEDMLPLFDPEMLEPFVEPEPEQPNTQSLEPQVTTSGEDNGKPEDELIEKPKKGRSKELSQRDKDIEELFAYWQEVSGQDTKINATRTGYLSDRLDNGYSMQDIKKVLYYVATDKWHKQKGYNTFDIAVRSDDQIDKKLVKCGAAQSNSLAVNDNWKKPQEPTKPNHTQGNSNISSFDDFFS